MRRLLGFGRRMRGGGEEQLGYWFWDRGNQTLEGGRAEKVFGDREEGKL